MASFGALTDHWGLADTNLILFDSNKEPVPQSRADARDENNDIAAATWFGNASNLLFTVSCSYYLKGGSLNLNTLKLGELEAGKIADNIDVSTGQNDWPTIVVTGMFGTSAVAAATGLLNTFTLPSLTINGIKQAQCLGFTLSHGLLQSTSFGFSAEMASVSDGVGEVVGHGISGAVGSLSASLVRVTDAPSWTLTLSGLNQTKAPGENQPQAAYHTTTATAEVILSRDPVQ